MPFRSAPRLARFPYLGLRRYFLTLCVRHRTPLFADLAAVEPVRTRMLRIAKQRGFEVVAYCFMPDHLHGLFEANSDRADLRELVRVFKQCSSYDWKKRTGTELWQRSYFDRVFRADEDTAAIARYILHNPVRAGLVSDRLVYPFLGSGTMAVEDLLASVQADEGRARRT